MNEASSGVAARKVKSRAEVRGWSDIDEIEVVTPIYNDGGKKMRGQCKEDVMLQKGV